MNIKTRWDKLFKQTETTSVEINNYLQSGIPTIAAAKMSKFEKSFNELVGIINDLDGKINKPIKAVKVVNPFDSKELADTWQFWKDYLLESFSITLQSRREQMALNYLDEISGHNADKAKKFLEYAMANGYRNFFVVTEKTKKSPAKKINEDGDFESNN